MIDEHEAGGSHLDMENCSNGKDGRLPASSTIFIIMVITKMGITHALYIIMNIPDLIRA